MYSAPMSLSNLIDIVSYICFFTCPLDILPPRSRIEAISIIGPSLLSIMNQSLSSGCAPESFQVASIQPFLKKLCLENGLGYLNRYSSHLPNCTFFVSADDKASTHAPLTCRDQFLDPFNCITYASLRALDPSIRFCFIIATL